MTLAATGIGAASTFASSALSAELTANSSLVLSAAGQATGFITGEVSSNLIYPLPIAGGLWRSLDNAEGTASLTLASDPTDYAGTARSIWDLQGSDRDIGDMLLAGVLVAMFVTPFAMTIGERFSDTFRRAFEAIFGRKGAEGQAEAKKKGKPGKKAQQPKANVRPVKVGLEHAPGASMRPPAAPGDEYGKRGIH